MSSKDIFITREEAERKMAAASMASSREFPPLSHGQVEFTEVQPDAPTRYSRARQPKGTKPAGIKSEVEAAAAPGDEPVVASRQEDIKEIKKKK